MAAFKSNPILLGFNEAPANSPGMGRGFAARRGPASGGFNEAPANSPGMAFTIIGILGVKAPGFNEAPANSPGMAVDGKHVHVGSAPASMRPRRIRRGWAEHECVYAERRDLLQ